MSQNREVLIVIQAFLPETTLTSEVRRAFIRFANDELKLSLPRVVVTTRLAIDKSKYSPTKYTKKNPHGLRNLRSEK
jgi:hypothetical protein